ncbi:MAG TPA: sigma factor-like helix-turn-helix DNA-binding protein [Symbiobacteriaceae bacterium]|nr:sigma factor-like helix-turn-helix DNA-binding protein [Symbiobacteriaceae bacterium]
MMLDQRPLASTEIAEGYAETAILAERRRQKVAGFGDVMAAAAWASVARYCTDMAKSKAMDDDQFKFQRDRDRHRREVPMTAEMMDVVGIRAVAGAEGSLRPWQEALIELAMGYLSPMQRVCFELVVGGLLTVKEVAEALDMDERQVRQHLARAKATMKRSVQPRIAPLIEERRKYR